MGKKDTIDNGYSIVVLDKVRIVRITMRTLFLLEEIYGTVGNALEAIRDWNDSVRLCHATINFLYATIDGMTKPEIEQHLTTSNIAAIHRVLLESLARDMPYSEAEGDENGNKAKNYEYDWDALYYRGRYNLELNDDEFWNATPRRFIKLLQLWDEAHGVEQNEKKEFYVDEIPW